MILAARRATLLGAAALLAAPAVRAQSRGTLRVGLGPQQPTQADTRRVWEPLYRRVAERLELSLSINVANDWAGISTAILNEQIDIAQMGPWGYILAHVNGGARIVNTMLVNGIPTYKAIVVGRPNLEIASFPDGARGMSMQMLDRGSTSGWLVPTHFLRSRGIEPQGFFGRYAEGASAAAAQMATANGQVDLATGWDTHRNTMIRNGTITATSNRVVWESAPLPNECVVVRRGMDEATGQRIGAIFAALSPADLESLPWPYTGFVPATHEPYRGLEQMGRDLGVLRS